VCLIKSLELLQWLQLSIMQQFGAYAFYMEVRWHKLGPHIILSSLLSVCQKLSNLVENWRSFDKTSWVIFGTPCTVHVPRYKCACGSLLRCAESEKNHMTWKLRALAFVSSCFCCSVVCTHLKWRRVAAVLFRSVKNNIKHAFVISNYWSLQFFSSICLIILTVCLFDQK